MASVRGSASIGTPNAPLAATLWQAPTPRAERVGALGCSITRTVGASTDRGSVGDASRICGGFLSSAWNTDSAGSYLILARALAAGGPSVNLRRSRPIYGSIFTPNSVFLEPEAAQSYSLRERGIPPRQSCLCNRRFSWEISKMAALSINGQTHQVDVDPNTPLLWALRDTIGLTGTKYGCGIAQCGACTVHMDGVAMRSCSVPVSAAEGKQITTIEGLAQNGTLNKVQKAWLEHDVPQCGYCQSGMIMAVAALLKEKPKPSDADIDANISNICRCGTYQQVRAAIHAAASA